MAELFTLENGAALITLTVLEIVLGIDNIVFIAILAEKVEESKRANARRLGLALAMIMRLGLLLGITWIMGLTATILSIGAFHLSGRDLVLLAGGAFLLYKATVEIHDKVEGSKKAIGEPKAHATFTSVIVQIMLMDMVFSLDSVITAVGMVKADAETAMWVPLSIMATAIIIAVGVMLIGAEVISRFIEKHPTTKMLALCFMLMIGFVLVAEGFHQHIGKGYIYAAMAFSVLVEALNLWSKANRDTHKEPAPDNLA